MTREQAAAWLDELVDKFLQFNDDVEWRSGAADALLALIEREKQDGVR